MRDLSYRVLWLSGGALLVALVIVLSLMPNPQSVVPLSLQDKTGHLMAYCTLMAWFAGVWRRPSHWALALGFIALGITLEWLQCFVALRVFDPLDMVANAAGVAFGLLLSRAGLDRWCIYLERSLGRVNRSVDGR
jgi:membrane associated rhomboid family serine protease